MDNVTTPWVRFFAAEWKPHWVHSSLLSGLADDAKRRWHEFLEVQPVEAGSEAFLDLPGMVSMDRTYKFFEVDGLQVCFPTQDCWSFLDELRGKPRYFYPDEGSKYWKLHGWMNCLVLNEPQRNSLLAQMEAAWPTIDAEAKAEDEEFARRIRSINSGGVKIVTPKVPESMEGVVGKKLVSKPNEEKN